jgi:hypothetical protein
VLTDDEPKKKKKMQVAGGLLKSKPTYVAIGNLRSLPHADEIGLGA